jgi:hypothetical protein
MTSLQSSFMQIPNKSRLIMALSDDNGFTQLKLTNTIAANRASVLSYDGTILNTVNASTFIGYINYGRSFQQYNQFRDLGKKLYIQTRGRTDYILSYVQDIHGINAEGVPDNYNINSTSAGNFWICTWAAIPDGPLLSVFAIRTG